MRRKGRGLGVWTILYDGDGYSGRILGGNFTVVREEMKQVCTDFMHHQWQSSI